MVFGDYQSLSLMDVLDLSGRGLLADIMDGPSRKRGGSLGGVIGDHVVKKVKEEGQRKINEFLGAPKGEPSGSGSGGGAGVAANAPNPIPAPTTTKEEGDGDGNSVGASGQVQDIKINRPIIIPSKPKILRKTYYKKNQFYINAINKFGDDLVAIYGHSQAKSMTWHTVPWRHSSMYMNDREWRNLQGISKMYRYKKCAFRFSNITCHTGLLTGTGTPSVQLGYNGVLCMSNILGVDEIGPTTVMYSGTTQPAAASNVKKEFSHPSRTHGYKPYPFHLKTCSQMNQIDLTTSAQMGRFQLPNIMDRMYTKVGSFPHTEWGTEIPDRWRNSFGTITPGTFLYKANAEFSSANTADSEYMGDSLGIRPIGNGNGRLYGCHSRMIKGDGDYYNAENIFPVLNRQQSNYGSSKYGYIDDLTLIKHDPMQFVFGFTLPVPEGTVEPNVYIAFELESEVEVEYVPLTFDNDNDFLSEDINLNNPINTSSEATYNANLPPYKKWDAVCNIGTLSTNRFLGNTDFGVLDVPITINDKNWYTSKTGQGGNFRDAESLARYDQATAPYPANPTVTTHESHNPYNY